MRHGRRVLILEDDADEARRSKTALSEAGYAVALAGSLAEARRVVDREDGFDVVFVDHHLPDGEGTSLIPVLRSHGVVAPVVLLTGNRSERVAEQAFEAGCVDTAVKDLDYQSWLPAMAEALVAQSASGGEGWGAHVLGLAVGRVHGHAVHAYPVDLWPKYGAALASATDLAARAVRATGSSFLGSLPSIHVQVKPDVHLVVALRGGAFAAALLSRPPTDEDRRELVAEAAAFSKAQTGGKDLRDLGRERSRADKVDRDDDRNRDDGDERRGRRGR